MTALAIDFVRGFVAALRGFLRGFVGAKRIGHDAHSVRCALAQRAETRRGCC